MCQLWVMLILRVNFRLDVGPDAMYTAQEDMLLREFESVRNYEVMPSKADVTAEEATG